MAFDEISTTVHASVLSIYSSNKAPVPQPISNSKDWSVYFSMLLVIWHLVVQDYLNLIPFFGALV